MARCSVGKSNLTKHTVERAVSTIQVRDVHATGQHFWQVHSTAAGLGGDLLLVKGARFTPLRIAVGRSHGSNGVRRGRHDAIGVTVKIPVVESGSSVAQLAALPREESAQSYAGACNSAAWPAAPIDVQRSLEPALLPEASCTAAQPAAGSFVQSPLALARLLAEAARSAPCATCLCILGVPLMHRVSGHPVLLRYLTRPVDRR